MPSHFNEKLLQTRELLKGLIVEFDELLAEVRGVRRRDFDSNRDDIEPDYVQRIARQRNTLMTAATLLADMRQQ
ncbi:MAG TPA: hypothetical protein VHU84_14415 [Lacipirellulaceae bacterium]|jgi:hypothetical protein|nr:hypothetical protein [Lacipirellulaceae bacterium]